MMLPRQITQLAGWSGWRRMAPAAGSLCVNVLLVLTVMASFTAGSLPTPRSTATPPAVSVTLVAEMPPPARAEPPAPAPSSPRLAPPQGEALPRVDKDRRRLPAAPQPSSSAAAAADDEGVYVGPTGVASAGPPLGLRGLLKKDPCNNLPERLRGDCDTKWGKMLADGEVVQSPTPQQLARMYPGFERRNDCGSTHLGCIDPNWVSLNGTHPVRGKSPSAAGPGGIQGIGELIGRLGPANEYQRDPGFGD